MFWIAIQEFSAITVEHLSAFSSAGTEKFQKIHDQPHEWHHGHLTRPFHFQFLNLKYLLQCLGEKELKFPCESVNKHNLRQKNKLPKENNSFLPRSPPASLHSPRGTAGTILARGKNRAECVAKINPLKAEESWQKSVSAFDDNKLDAPRILHFDAQESVRTRKQDLSHLEPLGHESGLLVKFAGEMKAYPLRCQFSLLSRFEGILLNNKLYMSLPP